MRTENTRRPPGGKSHLVAGMLLFMGLFFSCGIQAQGPSTGRFVTERGWGHLVIQENGNFSLTAEGGNLHLCELQGRIDGDHARMDSACVVEFKSQGNAIEITAKPGAQDACRDYCGVRASFEGRYLPEPDACSEDAQRAERSQFKSEYQARNFKAAAARLEKLLGACGRYLPWRDDAEIRNDLAIAQHHAGDPQRCLSTLAPLRDLLDMEEGTPEPSLKPWFAEQVPAIRFNWKLCGGKLPKRTPPRTH